MTDSQNIEELFNEKKMLIYSLIELANNKDLLFKAFKLELKMKYNNDLVDYINLERSEIRSLLLDYTKVFLDNANKYLLFNKSEISQIVINDYADNTFYLHVYYKNDVKQEFIFNKKDMLLKNVRVILFKGYKEIIIVGDITRMTYIDSLARLIEGVL